MSRHSPILHSTNEFALTITVPDSTLANHEISKSNQIVESQSISRLTQRRTGKRINYRETEDDTFLTGEKHDKFIEDDTIKYCLCRQPERHPMIGCDFCEEWYHGSCLNLNKEDIKQLTKCEWKCPKCESDLETPTIEDPIGNPEHPENCKICGLEFGNKSILNIHYSVVHCTSEKEQKDSLENSSGEEIEDESDFENSDDSFKVHTKPKKRRKRKHKCTICDATFTEKRNLIAHVQIIHDGKKLPKKYECLICSSKYVSNGELNRHVREVHEGKKPNKCSQCGKCFSRKPELNRHIKVIHEKRKPFKCDICDQAFARKDMIKSHFAAVHNGEKQYKCPLCDNSYSSQTAVIHHMGIVHDQNPYGCSLCEKKFPSKHALKHHRATVHEGKNKCNICNYSSTRKLSMKVHIKTVHTKDKPYKCNLCFSSFSSKATLTSHIKANHQENPAITNDVKVRLIEDSHDDNADVIEPQNDCIEGGYVEEHIDIKEEIL